jgi:hypothetical protein
MILASGARGPGLNSRNVTGVIIAILWGGNCSKFPAPDSIQGEIVLV